MAELDHVHFVCADAEGAAGFFRTYFAAEELPRIVRQDWFIARLKIGATVLAFSPPRPGLTFTASAAGPQQGFYHLGIRVADVDALVARMREAGTPIVAEPKDANPQTRVAYVTGPAGIEIELLQTLAVA
jgi:catechol 2,3-dioxygenase-like lactoylglutathione lyase family enzyme